MSDIVLFDLEYEFVDPRIHKRVDEAILGWTRCQFVPGQRCKGIGCDCVGFATGVLDDLYGFERFKWEALPYTLSIHNPLGAYKIAAKIRRHYPSVRVRDKKIHPGDWIVLGPTDGGPAHVALASGRKNVLWTVERIGVVPIGMGYPKCYQYMAHYRVTDPYNWLIPSPLSTLQSSSD